MEKESIRIVLAEQKNIGGIIRNPGYVLLEGVCPQNLAADEVGESIRLGQVKVEVIKPNEENEEAP
ncbi:MAG: hypothetical protein HZC18_02125 [Candidatus Omnitrophica bacterium]|nr:hypothetical protein [Candidatus Omnitrophota bacterium]